jgi:hypothetical protein
VARKQLVTKSAFARRAGVSASAIGKACKHELGPALSSGKINESHPAALEYLARREAATMPPEATGLDPLHSDVVAWCAENNRFSISVIQKTFKIGFGRAKSIVAVMNAAGLVPEPGQPVEITPAPTPKPLVIQAGDAERALSNLERTLSGQEKARLTKKQERPPEHYEPEAQLLQIPEDIRELANWSLRDLVTKFGTDVAFLDFLKATKELENIQEKRLKNAKTSGELVSRAQIKIGVIEPINTAHIKLLTDGAKTIAVRVKAMVDAERDLTEIEEFVTKQMTSFIKPMKAHIVRGMKNV